MICNSNAGSFKYHDPTHDGFCSRCGVKIDGSAPATQLSVVSSATPAPPPRPAPAADKIAQAQELAEYFWDLREMGPEEKAGKTPEWAKELVRLIDVASLEELKRHLEWTLKNEFWKNRVYVPKNFVAFYSKIVPQYKQWVKNAKVDPSADCSCPRTNGEINCDEEGGRLYDYDCLKHGHGLIPHYHYRIYTSRGILSVAQGIVKPPRFGQPRFDEHLNAMKKVLPKPRKRTVVKAPILPKNLDLPEL